MRDASLFQYIGKPLRRTEDLRLLKGEGRFTDDLSVPGQYYAVFVRSPHPHARLSDIDTKTALAMPGVVSVITADDLSALNPIDHSPLPSTRDDLKLKPADADAFFAGPHYLLPLDRVRHVGEAVAMVIASSASEARDAAECVDVRYEPLSATHNARASVEPDTVSLWDERSTNYCIDGWHGDVEGTQQALADAPHVLTVDFHVDRVTGVPLEPRAALAQYNPNEDSYSLVAGSGGAVRQRNEIANVLGIDPSKLRVRSLDVGGNFGTRNRVYVEFALVLWAAKTLNIPVKFTASRSESFLTDYQGRDLHSRLTLGLDAQGAFVALKAENLSNLGARAVSLSPLGKGSTLVTGNYRIPVACVRASAAFTNTVPTQAYRSSGRPEVNYALERTIDIAAQRFGFDLVDIRRKNLIASAAMPYANPLGANYDSGDYEHALDEALRLADWNGFQLRRDDAQSRGRLRGRGIAPYVESSIGSPRERADVHIDKNGSVTVVIGTQPTGQGQETSFAQVTADLLHVDFEAVTVVTGDTRFVTAGGGSHSGRSMRHAGTVIALAVTELIATAKAVVARARDLPIADIEFDTGLFRLPQHNETLNWFEVADLIVRHRLEASWPKGLRVVQDNEMHTPVFPNGCAVCEVEVDPETGAVQLCTYVAVDDVGRAINPLILHGQTHGSVAQGVGQALSEWCHIDGDSGQPNMGSLMDYAIPRADDIPDITVALHEVLSPTNPLGIKSGGEGATTPALAVVVNATVDALRHLNIEHIDMPLTPFNVWRAIRNASKDLPHG